MEFAALATALDAHVDKSKKIPKIICACPVGCGGTLTAKDFGDPDPVLICSAACSKDSIRSAIKRLEARSDPAEQSRERDAGEETPHSPASSLNGHTNGNGNGKVHHPDDEMGDIERDAAIRSWKRRLAKLARGLLKLDDEYKKPYLTVEMIIEPLVADLRRGMTLPEYVVPGWLSPTEVKEELESVARWAIDEHIKHQKEEVDRDIGGDDEDEEQEPLRPLSLGALYQLVDEFDRQPWVWEGILPQSSLSLIVGKSETGKSTLIYRLIASIVRGESFLGRPCMQGRVLYLAGDPISEIVAGKTLKELGLSATDGVQVVPGALVGQKNGMAYLRKWVSDFRPCLVVGDTLAATVAIDVDKYGQSYQIQQPLTRLARDFKPNFLMSHHSQKSAIDSYSVIDSALGSVGVAAVASTRMGTKMYQRQGKRFYTFAMSNSRIGKGIDGEYIVNICEDGHMEFDGLWGKRTVAMDQELILNVLKRQEQPIAERTLWGEIFPKPKWAPFKQALIALIENRTIEVKNRNKSGGGRIYSMPSETSSSNQYG
jgi:hypothetical protein